MKNTYSSEITDINEGLSDLPLDIEVEKLNVYDVMNYIANANPEEVRRLVNFAEPFCGVESIKQASERTGKSVQMENKRKSNWIVFEKKMSVKDD